MASFVLGAAESLSRCQMALAAVVSDFPKFLRFFLRFQRRRTDPSSGAGLRVDMRKPTGCNLLRCTTDSLLGYRWGSLRMVRELRQT